MNQNEVPSISHKPIRVAYIIGKMWAGGVETVVFNYYRAIDHSMVQFDFFYDTDSTVEPPEDIIAMGARFYKLPPYQKIWIYIPELKTILKENNYTIVHSHLNTLSVFPLYAAWRARIPVRIAHNHSVPGGNEWKRNIAKGLLRKFSTLFATDYFACSEKAGRWLFGDRLYDNGEVIVIKNAIDFGRFSWNDTDRIAVRSGLNIDDNVTVIGHVGRFTFAKNHVKLLRIFKEYLKDFPSAKLLLVGDGELREEIEHEISNLNIASSVILTGKVADPERYYSAMNVVVLPSIFEGFSMTTIEAQASHVPVVISEAVPDEAVISNGCFRVDTSATETTWIKAIENIIGTQVTLDTRKEEFDIKKCVITLQNWYIAKADSEGIL